MTLIERLRVMVEAVPAGGSVTIPRDWLAGELGRAPVPADPGDKPRPEPAPADRWLTAAEVAQRLHTSERWVYDHQAELGGKRLSRRCLRFSEAAVRRYMERRR